MDPAPNTSQPAPSFIKRLWLPLLCVLVLIAGITGMYLWQHSQLQSAQKSLATTKSQLAAAQKRLAAENEITLVDRRVYQAVFLGNEQVYFGKITSINGERLILTNVYYLKNANAKFYLENPANAGNVVLIKLGCEVHKPQDQLTINRSEVTFWENMKAEGKVSQAIRVFENSSPDQKCMY